MTKQKQPPDHEERGARQVFLNYGFNSADMNDVARDGSDSKEAVYAFVNFFAEVYEAIIRAKKSPLLPSGCAPFLPRL